MELASGMGHVGLHAGAICPARLACPVVPVLRQGTATIQHEPTLCHGSTRGLISRFGPPASPLRRWPLLIFRIACKNQFLTLNDLFLGSEHEFASETVCDDAPSMTGRRRVAGDLGLRKALPRVPVIGALHGSCRARSSRRHAGPGRHKSPLNRSRSRGLDSRSPFDRNLGNKLWQQRKSGS